jgi:large subunit ribosomal protein L29
MATANELRQMKPDEMARMLTEQRDALFNLKLKLRTGHLENTASLGAARKDVARLATLQREHQLGIVRAHKAAPAAKAPASGAKAKGKSAKATKAKASKE